MPLDIAGKLLDVACGGLGSAVVAAIPDRWRRQARARLGDLDPFSTIAGNHDLIRAVRLAWVEAALAVLDAAEAAAAGGMPEPGQTRAFVAAARPPLRDLRQRALDRRGAVGDNPIDRHVAVVLREVAEFVSPGQEADRADPLTLGFVPTLAALTWPEAEIPPLIGALGRNGLPVPGGTERRDFAALVLAAFAELIKDPTRYPEARVAFQIDMLNAVRSLTETTLAAVRGLDAGMDGRIEAALAEQRRAIRDTLDGSLREWIAGSLDQGLRAWLGITDLGGAEDPTTARVRPLIERRPTALLTARFRVVPYLDRGGSLSAALQWARQATAVPAQGRLYVAPGGFGKTRLALELADTLSGEGWRCCFLSGHNATTLAPGALPDLLRRGDARGVLLVLDYAETQVPLLRQVARAARAADAVPVRLLALARSSEGWWPKLLAEDDIAAVFEPEANATVETSLAPNEQAWLLARATAAFARALEQAGIAPPPGGPVSAAWSGRRFDRPLTVAMAAFLAARGESPEAERSVLWQVFQEERRHWARTLGVDPADGDVRMILLARAAAQVTLVQGATLAGTVALLRADPMATEHGRAARDRTQAALERLYGVESNNGLFLRPVEPDILGEHAAMAALADDTDDLAAATLKTALAGAPLFNQNAALMLTVLTRATRDEHDPRTRDSAHAVIRRLTVTASGLSQEEVRRLTDALPRFAVPLSRLAVAVAQRVVETTTDEADIAWALNNLTTRLSETGDRDGALAPARRAVAIRERLAEANPAAYLPALAMSLGTMGDVSRAAGDLPGAVDAYARCLRAFKACFYRLPRRFGPHLAMTARRLADVLQDVGRESEMEPVLRDILGDELYDSLFGDGGDDTTPA